ncbi:MAG: diguanylate phosphodiesterase [Betaproteobacteria bacterium HGW-Betaproteobacteria-8]|nr:MAG: diguanylate phosphodiesterase [Betaproteobacteria bacterium HGW-Betaproteobacteria-8]
MHEEAFIGRQPILDKDQAIIGYELLFRHSADAQNAVISDDLKACSRVLVNTLSDMGGQWLLGDKYAFINVNEEMLLGELIELLPPKRTVLEILRTVPATGAVLQRCKDLRARGYQISLDNPMFANNVEPLLALADYIKIDMLALNEEELLKAHALYKNLPARLVAEKVETSEQFEACQKMGIEFFQGFYFAKPETLSAKVINPSYVCVIDIINMVSHDADNKEIETGFKRDSALSFKLLRYINSVGFGLSCEIQSIGHALSILGRKQLYRWLTLLMVTAGNNTTSPALMKTSVSRGRLTELLGSGYFDKHGLDNLFIVGVFSMLDIILEMPMDKVLEKVQLPDSITEALLTREGVYGPFLQLAEACEAADHERIIALANLLQLDPNSVNDCHIAALSWVEELGI